MATVEQRLEELEAKLEGLAGIVRGSGLALVGHLDGSYRVVLCDKDGDGDFDPLISASWDGSAYSTSTGTVNWNTVFGVPTGAAAVFIDLQVRDSGSAGAQCSMAWYAKSTTTNPSLGTGNLEGVPNNTRRAYQGWIPVASAGTSYYSITATGADTFDVWIRVVAYMR